MQHSPFISICIPTFNQTNCLVKVIDSILSQSYKNYEIIVSDDSTTNLVEELVKKYIIENKNTKIKYFKNNTSLGTPENWNESIRNSIGEWIKIMHHDDRFAHNDALNEFVKLTYTNTKTDFVYSGSYYLDNKNIKKSHSIDNNTFIEIDNNPESLFLGNLIGPPSAVMFKNKNIYFDKKLKWLVDIEFYYRYINTSNNTNYTTNCLIESFIPEERVTNSCWMNKDVEVPEHLYCLIKHKLYTFKILSHFSNLFYQLKVYTKKDILDTGYKDKIPFVLLMMIFFKRATYKIKFTFSK
jgi:glycosyltransferase involved in cell wall biosynthesis